MRRRIIFLILSIIYFICCKFLLLFYALAGKRVSGTFSVIFYHEVIPEHRDRFIRQMHDIKRLTKCVAANFNGPVKKGIHYTVVTFDDGFQSVLHNAVPELERLNIPFSIFIPTNYYGKKPRWGKINSTETVMTQEQMVTLASNKLVTIGSHTHTHPYLTELDDQQIVYELTESKKNLEKALGMEINLLAFPYGAYNADILDIARQIGYKRVFSVIPVSPFSLQPDFLTGRIDVTSNDWPLEFRLKITGYYQWVPFAVAFKKKILCMFNK